MRRDWISARRDAARLEVTAQDKALTAQFEADLTPAERDYYALAEAEERQLRAELEAAGQLNAYLCGTLDQPEAEAEGPEAEAG